jgi:DNA-binding response OmpR family regulator/two-component sensor histidine kinase
METNNMMPLVTKLDINLFFREICNNFQPFSDKKFISTFLNGEVEKEIFVDPEKLEKVISNLLSNAFKYTPEYGKIFFNYNLEKKDSISWLCVEIIDSGQGIHISNIQQIFDRFYRIKSITGKTFGTGIGLALTKNLVEVHKGVINVENDTNYGAKFSFKIPVSEEAYSEDQIADETGVYLIKEFSFGFGDSNEYIAESGVPTPSAKGTTKILVVEDNIEFRGLIVNYLSYYFEVFEASNGVEGYDLALKEFPDLIVSDVMMPEMDGIEFCQKIKNNIETSHILVILLTAKVSDDARFQSYKSGADSYIPKPVSFKVLHARLNSLTDMRQRIIKRFSLGILPEINEINISSLDNNLLKKIKDEVEKNISDYDLNVTRLSEKLQLSSSMLYRKLTNLTGMSPVEFIRNIRVEHSAQLLRNSDSNVSEAAYNSGFNDLSYFTKCFKNHFGITPKNYKKKYSKS